MHNDEKMYVRAKASGLLPVWVSIASPEARASLMTLSDWESVLKLTRKKEELYPIVLKGLLEAFSDFGQGAALWRNFEFAPNVREAIGEKWLTLAETPAQLLELIDRLCYFPALKSRAIDRWLSLKVSEERAWLAFAQTVGTHPAAAAQVQELSRTPDLALVLWLMGDTIQQEQALTWLREQVKDFKTWERLVAYVVDTAAQFRWYEPMLELVSTGDECRRLFALAKRRWSRKLLRKLAEHLDTVADVCFLWEHTTLDSNLHQLAESQLLTRPETLADWQLVAETMGHQPEWRAEVLARIEPLLSKAADYQWLVQYSRYGEVDREALTTRAGELATTFKEAEWVYFRTNDETLRERMIRLMAETATTPDAQLRTWHLLPAFSVAAQALALALLKP
jgi:hypothetical protein